MANKVTMTIFLASIALTAHAQLTNRISGRVVDAENNEPLEYASISLKSRPIGTVTNADGRFDLYIPADVMWDTVRISFLGYNPYLVAVSTLNTLSNDLIRLRAKPLALSEVIVAGKTPIASEILATAFKRIDANFPTTPYAYTGFVRELWNENDKTVSLLDCAVEIYDDGYQVDKKRSASIREKVNLKFSRASENYMTSNFRNATEKYNSLTGALRWNMVKYRHPNRNDVKSGEAIIENVVSLGNRTLFVVSFISHSTLNDLWERKDTFYIDDETFAVKKFESKEYGRSGGYRSPQWPVDSLHFYQAKNVESTYEFEEYNGKMYLRYFNSVGQYDIFNARTKSVEYEIEGSTMIVVTDIKQVNKKNVVNNMYHRRSLASQTTPYDESFWTNYDQIKLVPLTDKQLKDLESKESLPRQFIRSAQRIIKRS